MIHASYPQLVQIVGQARGSNWCFFLSKLPPRIPFPGKGRRWHPLSLLFLLPVYILRLRGAPRGRRQLRPSDLRALYILYALRG